MIAGEVQLTVDPIVTGRNAEGEIAITTSKPPVAGRNWWPWVLGALVLGGAYYLTRDPREGRRGAPL